MERDSFVFYRSFFEAISCLDKEQKADCLDAIARYALDGEVIEMDGIIKALFLSMKPQIDANTRRYANGLKGGRPSNQKETKEEPKENQTKTKVKPNQNQTKTKIEPNNTQGGTNPEPNVNDNENDKKITPLTPLTGEKVTPKKPSELVDERNFKPPLKEAVLQWLKYKAEKKQGYKSTGLANFLTQVENNAEIYGAEKVAAVIRSSMGANYQGVVWDWLKRNGPPKAANDWSHIR